ncbi:MAG: ABC transporter permease [Isosphaeraceae bacterium]
MSRSHPLRELYLTRVREFYRQPARVFWVYGFPTVLAVVLGFAFQSRAPEFVLVDLVENASSPPVEKALRDHDAKAQTSGEARIQLRVEPRNDAMRRLMTGKTPLVIEARPSLPLIYHYDPTRPEATAARATIDDVLQEHAGRTNPLKTEDATNVEPGSRYIDFLIPGLLGVNTMGGGLWGIGFLIVNFRIAKLLKCFVATPMPRRDFLLSLLGARLTFLVPDLVVLLSLGTFAFGMPIRGSLLLVVAVDVVGALAFAGIGLLVGSRAQSTEAVSGLMNLVMLPMWLFSGVFFSSERFPDAIQPIIQALPLTQLLNALRAVILEGAGWLDVAPAMGILGLWAILTFSLALRIFRWS